MKRSPLDLLLDIGFLSQIAVRPLYFLGSVQLRDRWVLHDPFRSAVSLAICRRRSDWIREMLADHARFDVVVLAASSGGLDALGRVLGPLPKWLPVPLAIVQHLAPAGRSYLVQILNTLSAMPVDWAHGGERLEPGRIYIAPPTHHLLLDASHRCVLSDSARVNFSRPAADPLFQSAAASFGRRVLAVVLTGRLHDASAGVVAVKRAGGVVIAQSPRTCRAPSMPRSAIESGYVDFVIDVDTIASMIVSLVVMPATPGRFGMKGRVA